MKNFRKTVIRAVALSALCGAAHADLVQYSFTDTNNAAKALVPASGVTYINPKNTVNFALSAGIDRKVRLTVLDAKNKQVGTQTSGLLGANDKITANGKEYFGALFNMNLSDEGNYTIKAEILDSANKVVQTDSYQVIVDRTAPVLSDISWYMGYGGGPAPDGLPVFSKTSESSKENFVNIGSIQDGNGVSNLSYEIVNLETNGVAASGNLAYSKGNGEFHLGKSLVASLMNSIGNGKFVIKFIGEDAAGNKGKLEQVFYNNSFCPALPEFVGIYEDNKILPLVNGKNKVDKNPITALFKIKKEDYIDFNPIWGMFVSGATSNLEYVKDGDAYFSFSGVVDSAGVFSYPKYRFYNYSNYNCGSPTIPDIAMSESALPPKITAQMIDIPGYGFAKATFNALKSYGVPENAKLTNGKIVVEPRGYDQVAKFPYGGSCTIPAGSTECTATNLNILFNTSNSVGKLNFTTTVTKFGSSNVFDSTGNMFYYWDTIQPEILEISGNDKKSAVLTLRILKGGTNLQSAVGLKKTEVTLTNKSTNAKTVLTGSVVGIDGDDVHTVSISYKNVPEGKYSINVRAIDKSEKESSKDFSEVLTVDKMAPTIAITPAKSSIESLDEISFTVQDGMDTAPTVTAVELSGGPTNSKINLATRKSGSTYSLEYPVMFPSLTEGEKYTLSVSASDDSGNVGNKSYTFTYSPPTVALANDADGNLFIPMLAHEFKRKNGNILETAALKLKDGKVVAGVYPVSATLRADAKVALVVNGVTVNPGETKVVAENYDFAANAGKISLPLRPAQAGVVGTSQLLITTVAPNAPVLLAKVNTWKPEIVLQKNALEVVQGVDPVSVKVASATGSRCRITLNEDEARASDVIDDPVCLIEWDKLPGGVEPSPGSYARNTRLVELIGQLAQVGAHDIKFTLSMFDATGQRIVVGSGTEQITATSALGSASFAPASDVSTVNRLIQDLNFKIVQKEGGKICNLTMQEDRAKNDAVNRNLGSLSQQCYFEWLNLPDGLAQDTLYDVPTVKGSLAEKKSHEIKWRVSTFTRTGEKIVLNEQSYAINAIDPDKPEIVWDSKFKLEDKDVVVVPASESNFGVATITAVRSVVDIEIGDAQNKEITTVKPSNGATSTRAQRVLKIAPANAWTRSDYSIKANYNLIPELFTEKAMIVYVAPSANIKPAIEVEDSQGIDTVPYPVVVKMFDRTKPTQAYDAAVMGKWKVRLIREMTGNKKEPLTDFSDIGEDGKANFAVDLSGIEGTSMRFNVEAVLESPVEGYARTEIASRSNLVTIVRGGLIEGSIKATRFSGQAPFKTILKLVLNDSKNSRYTGEVVWEVSEDDGQTWKIMPVEERYKFQLNNIFALGNYKVRAKISNANTKVSGYTEAVDVISYNKAKAKIDGARAYFVGASADLKAVLMAGDKVLDNADYDIDWSLDGGKTFTQSSENLELSSEQPKHYLVALRVKPKDAPETDFSAYHTVRTSLDFFAIKAPRPSITGPLRMEKGKSYTFTARTSMPYPGMGGEVKGFFTLPDGQVVEGTTATYTPTGDDLQKQYVETKYTAWVEGFREAGAEGSTTARSRTWEYVFPNFAVEVRRTASVAPATITATLRAIGFHGTLEEPTYEWKLPEGVTVQKATDTSRVFVLEDTGISSFSVTVRDARGNEKVVNQDVVLGEPKPYEVGMKYTASNAFNREPLDVTLRPTVTGGHTLDRVQERTYIVNGQEIEATSSSARVTLPAGDHDIRYRIHSNMGAEAEAKVEIAVKPNQAPVCKATEKVTVASRVYLADCSDADGRIKAHEWTVNGQVVSTTSARMSLNVKKDDPAPVVTLVGIDDSGARSAPVSLGGN